MGKLVCYDVIQNLNNQLGDCMKVQLRGNKTIEVGDLEKASVLELDHFGEKEVFIVADRRVLGEPGLNSALGIYGWYIKDYGVEHYELVQFAECDGVRVLAERGSVEAENIRNKAITDNQDRAKRVRNYVKLRDS